MIPSWRGLNHFSQVCEVQFTDGTKYEDISKVRVSDVAPQDFYLHEI